MESSKFIQLSDGILLEYIYTSQTNPTELNTSIYPIEIMRDGHTDGSYLFNTDSVSAEMGNYRDISAAAINKNKTQYAYLDTDIGVPYNDFDPELTDSANLLQTFNPQQNIAYDKIRVHFVAGFTFTGYDGIIFETLVPRRDGTLLNLSSINFLKTDTPVFNPDPVLINDNLYATYIEWRVPSLFFMNNSFSNTVPNGLGYRLTEGQGFLSTPTITFKATGIYETVVDNGYNYYNVEEINAVSLPSRDIYDNLYASVVEADGGDYFELSGEVTGSTFSNFIAQLNSSGGDYVVFHEINVSEQINTSFVKTSTQVFTQTTNFDNPILFRPIILNSAIATSFSINYLLRLYNRADNTQILKSAKLTSFDVKKYGRRLMKINLGVVPTVANVYNQLANDDGSNIIVNNGGVGNNPGQTSTEIVEQLVIKNKYVTTFRDRINVKAAISPAKIQTITDTEDGSTN
ncbi:MAG: hypothetical protein CMJ25_06180 [Phycisphaerae bacterium]|nr:hypothetical protein [Phycisphaerae bacterium]|tara:strand:+ start:15121 stop:16500 length:1380 start_codon:yes stop_codon:yes gene_type:complete